MSDDISKPYTIQTKETKRNYEEGWDRIFGQKERLKRQLHEINSQRHKIIDGIQAKHGRTNGREWELLALKKKREKITRDLDRLNYKKKNGKKRKV
jgi:hypothetical protein